MIVVISYVANITFIVAEIISKVAVVISSVALITYVVDEISSRSLFVPKITFVVAEKQEEHCITLLYLFQLQNKICLYSGLDNY